MNIGAIVAITIAIIFPIIVAIYLAQKKNSNKKYEADK